MSINYAPGPTGTENVLFAVDGGLGRILLNRPKAINSLDTAMCAAISERLDAWAADDSIQAVSVQGAGERGLCAGGDVKAVRQAVVDDPNTTVPEEFFTTEYEMNLKIAEFPKPYIAIMDGITMGGGVGVSAHGSQRLVTQRTKIAMPETIIGFFPDTGILPLLADCPGEFGTHLALTGATIDSDAAMEAGLADARIDAEKIEDYLSAVAKGNSYEPLETVLDSALVGQEWIDECYAGGDPVAILERLKNHADPSARQAAELIEARSPFAVSVTLAALRRAKGQSVADVLQTDLKLAKHFRNEPDFLEGVRCQLVDRGDTPQWRHASLADVDQDEVEALF